MNKGLRLLFCRECGKKRFCKSIPIEGYNFRKVCSREHEWIIEGFTLERINAATQDVFSSSRLSSLFERDDMFYSSLMREKK